MSSNSLEGIKAVLFDFDETLIDAPTGLEAAHEAVVEKICEDISFRGLNLTRKEMVEKLSEFDDRMNLKKIYDRDLWWPRFLDKVGIDRDLTDAQIEELTDVYWTNYQKSAPPYPDAESVLEYLVGEGYSLGIVTDTDGTGIPKRERITRFDFSELFKTIIVAGRDTSHPKPDSECFELAAEELDVGVRECVMVGDKPFTDIRGAKKVGMATILLERREWSSEEEPSYMIENLSDLKKLL